MTSSQFLEYQISLLLAEFDSQPVLSALANKLGATEAELRAQLEKIGSVRPSRRTRTRRQPEDVVRKLSTLYPEKAERLIALSLRFQNREFLPTLRDVQRFFAQHTGKSPKIDSRSKALPKLLALLADMSAGELDRLREGESMSGYSALSDISGEVLRRA
jgi:hypothetical protein